MSGNASSRKGGGKGGKGGSSSRHKQRAKKSSQTRRPTLSSNTSRTVPSRRSLRESADAADDAADEAREDRVQAEDEDWSSADDEGDERCPLKFTPKTCDALAIQAVLGKNTILAPLIEDTRNDPIQGIDQAAAIATNFFMANLHAGSSFVVTEAWLSEVVSTKGGKEQTNGDLATAAYQNYLSVVRGHVEELLLWGLQWPEHTHVAGRFSMVLDRSCVVLMKEAAFPVIDQDFFRVALDEKDGEWPSSPECTAAFSLSVAVTRERGIFLAMLHPDEPLTTGDTDITEMTSLRHHPELHLAGFATWLDTVTITEHIR